jgi:hypothetical protein
MKRYTLLVLSLALSACVEETTEETAPYEPVALNGALSIPCQECMVAIGCEAQLDACLQATDCNSFLWAIRTCNAWNSPYLWTPEEVASCQLGACFATSSEGEQSAHALRACVDNVEHGNVWLTCFMGAGGCNNATDLGILDTLSAGACPGY